MKHIPLLTLLCILSFVSYSQDCISLKSQSPPVYGKILEISSTKIIIRTSVDSFSDLTVSIDSVEKVTFQDSVVFVIFRNEELSINKRLLGLKFGLIAPLMGHVNVTIEHYLKNKQSIDLSIGVIRANSAINNFGHDNGVYASLGYRFYISNKTSYRKNDKQFLNGLYVKPELLVGGYRLRAEGSLKSRFQNGQNTLYYDPPPRDTKVAFSSLMFGVGYQVVLRGGFTMDLSFATGYTSPTDHEKYSYAIWSPDINFPIVLSGGVKIGYTFCKEKRFQLAE